SPLERRPRALVLAYFVGLLVLGWLLEARSVFFVAFMVVGFFQAFELFPIGLAVLAIGATSFILYVAPAGSGWADPRALPVLPFTVMPQTTAVSAGSYIGIRMSEEQEKRKKTVAELETALKENAGLQAQLVAQAREAGVLDERQRLAGEIHDTIAQGLTGII